MKKTLSILGAMILHFLLLTACGGNSGSKSGSSSDSGTSVSSNVAKAQGKVIKVAELISKEDASALLGQSMQDGKVTFVGPFADIARYESKNNTLQINLVQEALHKKDSGLEKNLLKNGWSGYMQQMEKAYTKNDGKQNITEISGMLGKYYLQKGEGFGTWILHVFYGEYYMTIALSNASMNYNDSEAEIAWKHEKIKKTGDLAVERLKAIVG